MVVGVAILGGVLVSMAMTTEVVRNRMQRLFDSGSRNDRTELYIVQFKMIMESPVVGWGPIDYEYEIMKRAGTTRGQGSAFAAHNIYLQVLGETGLLGAIPFGMGIWLILRSAWRARYGSFGILPLALTMMFLASGMTANWLLGKPFWFMMAFGLTSESHLVGLPRKNCRFGGAANRNA